MKWEPADWIVAGITGVVCAGLFAATVAPVIVGIESDPEEDKLIVSMYMALIAIISLYLGLRLRK